MQQIIILFAISFQVAPALTAIALFLVDDRVRSKMFNLCASAGREADNGDKKD